MATGGPHSEWALGVQKALGMEGERVTRIVLDINALGPVKATVYKIVDQRIKDVNWFEPLQEAQVTVEEVKVGRMDNAIRSLHWELEEIRTQLAQLLPQKEVSE